MPIVDNELVPEVDEERRGEVVIRHETVTEWLFDNFTTNIEKSGDKNWLTDVSTEKTMKYSEIIPAVKRIASGLHRKGFRAGDRLAVMTTNFLELPLTLMANFHLGGCTVTLSHVIITSDIRDRCIQMKPRFIVTDELRVERVLQAVKDLHFIQEIFVIAGNYQGCTPFDVLLNDDGLECPEKVVVDLDETISVIMYSSGTTGLPKPIVYPAKNIMGSMSLSNTSFGKDAKFMWINSLTNAGGILAFLICSLNYNEGFMFSDFTDDCLVPAIDKYKPTAISAFPVHVAIICRTPDLEKYDMTSVKIFTAGGSAMNPFYEKDLFNKLPNLAHLFTNYGMTEVGMCVSNLPRPSELKSLQHKTAQERHIVGSCGKIMPGCRLKVIDPDTREKLGPNQIGEICLKSLTMMQGYYGNQEATQNTIIDGWGHTGDQGYYDQDGNVFITGRYKELIKYKNAHIAPANLEKYLLLHPEIKDAVVVGLPHEIYGQLPLAFVVRKEGSQLTAEDIHKFVEDKVPDDEKLRGGVRFIDQIPRNDFQKPVRHKLVKMIAEENN